MTLFTDLARALIHSGFPECYIVAGDNFQTTGPAEIIQVLSSYCPPSPGMPTFQVIAREYQSTHGTSAAQLTNHGVGYVRVDGAVVRFTFRELTSKSGTRRLLLEVVDPLSVVTDLDRRLADVESSLANALTQIDVLARRSGA